jgi:hypothetical protein
MMYGSIRLMRLHILRQRLICVSQYESTTGNPQFLEYAAQIMFGEKCEALVSGQVSKSHLLSLRLQMSLTGRSKDYICSNHLRHWGQSSRCLVFEEMFGFQSQLSILGNTNLGEL